MAYRWILLEFTILLHRLKSRWGAGNEFVTVLRSFSCFILTPRVIDSLAKSTIPGSRWDMIYGTPWHTLLVLCFFLVRGPGLKLEGASDIVISCSAHWFHASVMLSSLEGQFSMFPVLIPNFGWLWSWDRCGMIHDQVPLSTITPWIPSSHFFLRITFTFWCTTLKYSMLNIF